LGFIFEELLNFVYFDPFLYFLKIFWISFFYFMTFLYLNLVDPASNDMLVLKIKFWDRQNFLIKSIRRYARFSSACSAETFRQEKDSKKIPTLILFWLGNFFLKLAVLICQYGEKRDNFLLRRTYLNKLKRLNNLGTNNDIWIYYIR
jgi:hypothetical protein